MWRAVAWILARPWIARELIFRAFSTPYKHILSPNGEHVYMRRYWLFNPYDEETRQTKHRWCPWSIRIHQICRPDHDPHLHDHPWDFRTFILAGSYVEDRESGTFRRGAGDTVKLKHGEFHRIAWVSGYGAWTLFVTSRYRGTWGFKVGGVKIPWREYLAGRRRP